VPPTGYSFGGTTAEALTLLSGESSSFPLPHSSCVALNQISSSLVQSHVPNLALIPPELTVAIRNGYATLVNGGHLFMGFNRGEQATVKEDGT